jgi:hypothetical protein
MQNRKRIAQGLVALGSLALLVCAALHGIAGYHAVFGALQGTDVPPRLIPAFKAVWLFVSWHWIAVDIFALIAAYGQTSPRRTILLLCGLVPLVDAAGAYYAIGLFIGDELLAVAALAFLASAALFPPPPTQH